MKAKTLPLFLLFAAGAALADDAAILACRALPATAGRLACYDAIPVGSASAPAAARPVAAVSTAPAPAATPEARFGLEQVKPAPAHAGEPTFIDSTIDGNFSGWVPSTLFRLANGQVWRVVDGSSAEFAPASNQRVKIARNLFGTMFLEVPGSNQSAKVRRVR
jgi:hypothetical protein